MPSLSLSSGKKHNGFEINGAFLIGLATLIGYLGAYGYELGTFLKVGIPFIYLEINIQTILCGVTFFAALLLFNFPKLESKNNDKEKMSMSISLLFMIIGTVIVVGYWKDITFGVLVIIIFSIFWAFIRAMPILDKSKYAREWIIVLFAPAIFIFLLFLVGYLFASLRVQYQLFSSISYGNKTYAVVRAYNKNMLGIEMGPDGVLTRRLKIITIESLSDQNKTIDLPTWKTNKI